MSEDDKKDNDKFPPYIHVLIPKDHDETKFDGGNQWLGVLGAIKGEISATEESLNKKITGVEDSLNKKMDESNKKLETKISAVEESLDKKISGVEEALNKKIDEILSILKSNPMT